MPPEEVVTPAVVTAAAGTGGATAAAAAATGLPAPPAWLSGADAETTAYLQSKGWDKATNPAEAIFNSYRNLEKLWGADKAGQTVQIPGEGADEKTLNNFFTRLGRPEAADKYSTKVESITGMPKDIAKGLNDLAFKEGFTDKQYKAIVQWNNDTNVKLGKDLETTATVELAGQQAKLKTEWGAAHDQNIQVAKEAATKLGWTAEQITAMQIGLGYDGVMKLAHQLGVQVGEGKYVTGEGGRSANGSNVKMSPAQATAELKTLQNDPKFKEAWLNKLHPDHAAMMAKKSQLSAWSVGEG